MKIYLSLPIALLLFIFSANSAICQLESDALILSRQLQQIDTAAAKGDTLLASATYDHFRKDWQQTYNIWAMLTDHDTLEEINRLLIKIEIGIKERQPLSQDIADIAYLLQSVPRGEKITWQNLL